MIAALQTVFGVLAACAVKATVLFALAWIVCALARRRSAATRHHIWAVATVCALVLPLLQIGMPAWHAGEAGRAVELWGLAGAREIGAPPPRTASVTVDAVLPSLLPRRLFEWLALIWALGFTLVAMRLAIGLSGLLWVSARARPVLDEGIIRQVLDGSRSFGVARPVRVLAARSVLAMPSTWGWARPRILLPAGCIEWSAERRRAVLAHELSHVRRFDWPIRIAAECMRALYWFHPLAWLAAAQLRDQSELACDDAVLASGIPPDDYATQLLDLVRSVGAAAFQSRAALAVARPSNLERRFTSMLDSSLNRRGLTRNAAILTTIAGLLLLLPLAALRAPAQDTAGRFSGAVFDPSGRPVSNATVVMTNSKGDTKDMTVTNTAGLFQFGALPAGTYELKILKQGFAILSTAGVALDAGREVTQNATLDIGTLNEELDVTEPSPTPKPAKIRVGNNVQNASLITKVAPIYPAEAKAAGIQGAVFLKAVVGKDGAPLSLRVQNAEIDPSLARAAVEAVSQWRYRPTLLNGDPVEVVTNITVNFTLSQ